MMLYIVTWCSNLFLWQKKRTLVPFSSPHNHEIYKYRSMNILQYANHFQFVHSTDMGGYSLYGIVKAIRWKCIKIQNKLLTLKYFYVVRVSLPSCIISQLSLYTLHFLKMGGTLLLFKPDITQNWWCRKLIHSYNQILSLFSYFMRCFSDMELKML